MISKKICLFSKKKTQTNEANKQFIWLVSWLVTTILTRINHSNNVSLQQILEIASVGINASLDTLDE